MCCADGKRLACLWSECLHWRMAWVCVVLWPCLLLCLVGQAGSFEPRPRFPQLNRRGMLPALMGKNRGPRQGLEKGAQVAMPQKMAMPKNPKMAQPGRRVPPEQPRVRYDHVLTRNSEETRYKWTENQRAFFTCPRDSFIAEISYRFDAVQSQLVKPFGWGANGNIFTVRDKFSKGLSPEKTTASFLRQPRSGKDGMNEADAFRELVNPPIAQSPLTETGCDPVLFCLGHQACLFKVTVDLCAADPVPGKRKMFFVNVRCAKDSTLSTYLWSREEPVVRKEMDQVMHMVHDDKASNQYVSQIFLHTMTEEEIFGVDCPKTSLALRHGYGGWCTLNSPPQIEIANYLWPIIGRVSESSCRAELVEAYCAYHYNTSGGCIPPSFIDKPKDGHTLKPGDMPFSFRAIPKTGSRPDMSEHEKVLSDPKVNLVPAKIGFLILAHNNPDAVEQLLKAVYRPYFFYVIHVDQRADEVRQALREKAEQIGFSHQNIRVLPKERSFVASWGSYEIVRAELEGFEELLRMGVWDFVINLSGSDLPIRDVDDVAAMLASARGSNFMRQNGNWNDRSDKPTDFTVWYGCGGHVYNVSTRGRRPAWTDMHSASQWAIFSRDFINLVVSHKRGPKMDSIQFFSMTSIIPDESFMASMLKISPYRETYVHYNLHHLKSFARKDDRGFCRHTEDIDFCGQGPGTFEAQDIDTIGNLAHVLFFARKFDASVNNPVRLFALELSSGKYYSDLLKAHISEEFVRQLVNLALQSEYGALYTSEVEVEEIRKLRIIPQVLPLDPCCRPVYNTKNRLVKDLRYWIDFSLVEIKTGERRVLRASFVPQSRTQCFSRGHIKGLYLTTKQGESGKTQVKGGLAQPTEEAGSASLYMASFININEKIMQAPACNEVEGLPDDSFEGRSPDSFSYASFPFNTDSKKLHFNASLVDPQGEIKCLVEVIITWKTPHASVQKSDTVRYMNTLNCGPMEPGLWTLVLFQRGVKEPFPYTVQIFLTEPKTQGWMDFKKKDTTRDELHGIWMTEDIRELSEAEIKQGDYAMQKVIADSEERGEGIIVNHANSDPGAVDGRFDRFGHEADYDKAQGEGNSLDRSRLQQHAKQRPREGDDSEDRAADEGAEYQERVFAAPDDELDVPRGVHRRHGHLDGLKAPPQEGQNPDKDPIPNRARGEAAEPRVDPQPFPKKPIRSVDGKDILGRHLKNDPGLLQIKQVDAIPIFKKQSPAVTFLEFIVISALIFVFIKGVLVPLHIVKRGSGGIKSFGTFLVVITLIQFIIYLIFTMTEAS
ncbi:uncharacterized protein LOC110983369 isoform X2 [Acanthaster planci]|uniref:protein xylosyltransferase n=1 Tax=Acanthaster planci TaxID=133434 RepID=A0A8B7YY61_ACAPL|nr:uncharacterized protein LOC110983369 isoform X2 [Acanthaster planci]